MKKLKITRKAFRAWLEEHVDLWFERQRACECPLAIYLGAGCDHAVEVDHDSTVIDGVKYTNPRWVELFIGAVDERPGRISAKTAARLAY